MAQMVDNQPSLSESHFAVELVICQTTGKVECQLFDERLGT